jgi:hypothetical protein
MEVAALTDKDSTSPEARPTANDKALGITDKGRECDDCPVCDIGDHRRCNNNCPMAA